MERSELETDVFDMITALLTLLVTRDCNANPVMLVAVLANAAHYHSLLFVLYSSGANFSTFTEVDNAQHTLPPLSRT